MPRTGLRSCDGQDDSDVSATPCHRSPRHRSAHRGPALLPSVPRLAASGSCRCCPPGWRPWPDPAQPVDPERFIHSGNEQTQADVRVMHEVHHRVDAIVAETVRHEHRVIVEHANEPRCVTSRRDVRHTVGGRTRPTDKRRAGDEVAAVLVEMGERLPGRAVRRRATQGTDFIDLVGEADRPTVDGFGLHVEKSRMSHRGSASARRRSARRPFRCRLRLVQLARGASPDTVFMAADRTIVNGRPAVVR